MKIRAKLGEKTSDGSFVEIGNDERDYYVMWKVEVEIECDKDISVNSHSDIEPKVYPKDHN